MTAINERLHLKGTASRPGMDGWVDKNGSFAIGVSSPVIGKMNRTTYVRAKVTRESGVTTIKGDVPGGASPRGQVTVFVAMALVAVALIAGGSAVLALVLIPFAALLYIPMKGDYVNSEILIGELQKVLKAKPTPPKAPKASAKTASTTRTTAPARPAPAKAAAPAAAKQPVATLFADDDDDDDDEDDLDSDIEEDEDDDT